MMGREGGRETSSFPSHHSLRPTPLARSSSLFTNRKRLGSSLRVDEEFFGGWLFIKGRRLVINESIENVVLRQLSYCHALFPIFGKSASPVKRF